MEVTREVRTSDKEDYPPNIVDALTIVIGLLIIAYWTFLELIEGSEY